MLEQGINGELGQERRETLEWNRMESIQKWNLVKAEKFMWKT